MNISQPIFANSGSPHHLMLGMRLDYLDPESFVSEFVELAANRVAAYCCVPDVYQCVICQDDPDHMAIVNSAEFVFSDSTIMQRARALRHGVKAIETLLGSNLMLALLERASNRGVSIALIGGRDEAVLADLKNEIAKKFPELNIAYSYSPPFRNLSSEEESAMLEGLQSSGAQLVFVGLGCPKQERWMGKYREQVQASMIGVGAAFDTIAGLVPPSPPWVHRCGLEWAYRLFREPKRLYRRYLVYAPRFVSLLLWDWFSSKIARKH